MIRFSKNACLNSLVLWSLYFTPHTCSVYSDFLQRHRILSTTLLNHGYLKNRLILCFKKGFRRIWTSCWKLFCQLRRDDERWYLQLQFGSKLTIVSLLCENITVLGWLIWFIVLNATFSNISAIAWRPVLVMEEVGVPGEYHRPWASNW
jgi:hypothetical protein